MHIGWPQGIYLTIIIIATVFELVKAGEEIENKWTAVIAMLLVRAAAFGLLYWGGFFDAR